MSKRTLSKDQRNFVLERDGYQCMFHSYYKGKGLVRCPNTTNLHVHHIKPHRWLGRSFKVIVETPYNLITLCKCHHFNHIHPDMADALKQYHADKGSVEKVFVAREKLISRNIPYWVQRYDDFLKWLAKEATNAFDSEWPK